VVRHVAAGAAEAIPLMRARNLARVLRELKQRGIFLLGTSDQAKYSLYEANFSRSIGLVMGAEETGIRRLTADLM
jgi:23S rRNA (guanosine2251-2'-O)-methyltransferase